MKSVEHTILEGGHRKLGKGKQVMKDACKVHLRIGVVSHETIVLCLSCMFFRVTAALRSALCKFLDS
jgi:hypothetical protein